MKLLSGSRVLVLCMTLLLGCRSEKTAFEFRPPTSVAVVASAPVVPPAPEASTEVQPVMGSSRTPVVARVSPRRSVGAARPATPARLLLHQRREIQQVVARQTARHKPRQTAEGADLFHVILGSLVIITGVILGLLLGGWLGLGVGAAVVILGYYFLMLGIGGKHAWLEIFQEFFNM